MSGAQGQGQGDTVAGAAVGAEPLVTVEGGAGAPSAAPPVAAGLPPWMQARLDQMTARMNAAERRATEAERQRDMATSHNQTLSQEIVALRSASGQAGGAGGAAMGPGQGERSGSTPASANPGPNHEEAVRAEAERIVREQRVLDEQNASVLRGETLHRDFRDVVGQLRNLGGVPTSTLEMVMETGGAEHIMYALGKDLNRASQIFAMPAGKQAVELAKLAERPKAPPAAQGSGAPPPMQSVGGKGAGAGSTDVDAANLSTEEWMGRRQAQLEARRTR